jgi:rhamnosyl/mannosyltransferase
MESVLQVLAEGERVEVENHVLVANETPGTRHETVNGVPVTRVGAIGRVGAVALCPTFPYWLRKLDADVMVVHEPNPVALVAHALAQPRARLVFWIHAEVVRPAWRYRAFYRPFLRRVLKRADRIVVASPPIAEEAEEIRPFRAKCCVIPYAIDPARQTVTPSITRRIDELKGADPRPMVLFVGRLVRYKGVEVLLRALAGSNVRASIVGDGPLRGELEALSGQLGLADRVHFFGSVAPEELTALYHASDVFVLPSITRAEAFGMVQLEAMACGKPVVSTRLPSGVPWVNKDGVTGIVVEPGNADALARAIGTLLSDAQLRQRLGEAGRQRVASEFTVPRLIDQTVSLYESILAGAGAPAGVAPVFRS